MLPEELRVRQAVGEGIARGLRDVYSPQQPLPDAMDAMLASLARLDAAEPSLDRDGRHAARVLALGVGILFSLMLVLNAFAS